MHRLIGCATLLLLLIIGCETPSQESLTETRPNIIYILADDLGYGELGSYGQTKIKTPHLDRLAAEGLRFTQHYSGSPVCAPSRCTLLTGKHTGHCQVRDNYELGGFADDEERGQLPLTPGATTLGTMLQHQGYATAAIGKWGLETMPNVFMAVLVSFSVSLCGAWLVHRLRTGTLAVRVPRAGLVTSLRPVPLSRWRSCVCTVGWQRAGLWWCHRSSPPTRCSRCSRH